MHVRQLKLQDLANNVINAFRLYDKKDNGRIITSKLRMLGDKLTELEVEIMLKEAYMCVDGNIIMKSLLVNDYYVNMLSNKQIIFQLNNYSRFKYV
jgi:Ca2+-binding EF-hand superfamily protein